MMPIHSPIRALAFICFLSAILTTGASAIGAVLLSASELACSARNIEMAIPNPSGLWSGAGLVFALLLMGRRRADRHHKPMEPAMSAANSGTI
jgi:hypothetical protein